MGKLDYIYKLLPVKIQNIAVSTFGLYWRWLRFGGVFSNSLSKYKDRECYSEDDWQKFQQARLTELLLICVQQVPYYRKVWDSDQKSDAMHGLLDKLPILEKSPLRESANEFIREDVHPYPKLKFLTSGTSGTPISSFWTKSELREAMAFREVRSLGWASTSFKLPRATFSGRMVEPDPQSKGPFYRFNSVEKQVYFSAFHLKPSNASKYVDALWDHKVEWLTGYAVSFFLLGKYILDQKLRVPKLKAVITTSEKVTPEMRMIMEQAYGCKVYEEYSTVESALFASECEYGRLHVSPDVSIVEILRPDGSPCDAGEIGEVVTTCLFRTYQPLIRFRLGDLAAWDPDPCPCGRHMPVIKEVVGRIEDVITGPDGRQLVRFHGIFVNQPNIIEGQIIQETQTDFIIKVVPTINFSDSDTIDIQQRMRQRLGNDVNIKVCLVDAIPRTKSGKFQAVISRVK